MIYYNHKMIEYMVTNNIEVDVKIKLLEANLTQVQLGEKNRNNRSIYQPSYKKGYDSQ